VWDWQENSRLNCFSNNNSSSTFVSSFVFVNPLEEQDMLMTAATDGVIRIWGSYYSENQAPTLVSAWRAHKPLNAANGIELLWDQCTGHLVSARYTFLRNYNL
jgi:hypothetical protein